MDWGTAIIGTISILICIVPFVIVHYNRVKREKKMLQALKENAHQNNANIGQHEFCGDFLIGMDENRNYVFFLKQKKEETISQFVDLSEIQACQPVKKILNLKSDGEKVTITERLELCFLPEEKSKGETRFELYDKEANIQLSGELQLADKWSKQFNNSLKKQKVA